ILKVFLSSGDASRLRAIAATSPVATMLSPLTRGGSGRWSEVLTTRVVKGADDGPFAVDTLTLPDVNPWSCLVRPSGVDFFPGGRRAAVCTWDGDVERVDGLDDSEGRLTWRRIASGLFQPLGLKIVDGQVYVSCRDQITRLRDLDGDGETDVYEC